MPVDEAPDDQAVRQSYNFAPGYHGLVYRADVPDWGAGGQHHEAVEAAKASKGMSKAKGISMETSEATEMGDENRDEIGTKYKLQAMKWGMICPPSGVNIYSTDVGIIGLVPFWTKRNPDYGSMLKTINCRDDSLIEPRGMWNTMKQKKRCIVICQGFYEWLKKNGGKEKIPHFTKRRDGKLMCLAGLWDCVEFEGSEEKLYTYTIITTSSNKQLNFLHDRMPVILENGSTEMNVWLDPGRSSWSEELQQLCRPYEGDLEIYPVSKEVGKVGNNSPAFLVPISSSANKNNIANFFKKEKSKAKTVADHKDLVKEELPIEAKGAKVEANARETGKTVDEPRTEDNAPDPIPKVDDKTQEGTKGVKRENEEGGEEVGQQRDEASPPKKVQKIAVATRGKTKAVKSSSVGDEGLPNTTTTTRRTRSATSNGTAAANPSPSKGSKKITSFFGK